MSKVEFDPSKRKETLEVRGLDMAEAADVFAGPHLTFEDDRRDYGERRFLTVGFMAGRMVLIAWTPRGARRRIISMRKTNEREQAICGPLLG
ncbi:BrnT family toxin [Frigidibacter oleivorans]|uniref:BrnT family toxin n=1 Tax=Frigidibacter oleivorans TaxID=2487129 RepID=UPI000F8F3C86|nr:BrnT family toxin [Frigidibacter oleivorans]